MTLAYAPLTKRLYEIGQTATILGVSRKTVSRWISAGIIKKHPGTNRIPAGEIARVSGELIQSKPPEQRRRGRYGKGRE